MRQHIVDATISLASVFDGSLLLMAIAPQNNSKLTIKLNPQTNKPAAHGALHRPASRNGFKKLRLVCSGLIWLARSVAMRCCCASRTNRRYSHPRSFRSASLSNEGATRRQQLSLIHWPSPPINAIPRSRRNSVLHILRGHHGLGRLLVEANWQNEARH